MNNGQYESYNYNKDLRNGFVYTGLKLITENCPDSEVYFVTNNENNIFGDINASNYHFSNRLWNEVAPNYQIMSDSTDHSQYHNILRDLCASKLVGYNGYSYNMYNPNNSASNDKKDISEI